MGFFDKLKQKSDNFFDGLQQNAIDKALAAAKEKNKQPEVSKPYGTDTDDIMERIEEGNRMIAEKMASYVGPKRKDDPSIPYVNVVSRTPDERFKRIKMGMDINELRATMMGNPKNIVENATNGKIKTKYYYEKSTNRLGNDAYDFEVTLENGKVTGWKDRRNRGTRDI
jgi:hypothetical protein